MKKLIIVLTLLLVPTLAFSAPSVVIKTNLGKIEVELNEEKAPLSTANFLNYVDAGFYNGTIFHRVIPNFMIQGGGFTKSLARKVTKAAIKNEATNGLKNKRGTIAMARTNVIDSGTSQFFINHADNAFLDHKSKTTRGYGYAVFGEVTQGMDIVDKIAAVRTGRKKGMADVPVQPVIIQAVERLAPK